MCPDIPDKMYDDARTVLGKMGAPIVTPITRRLHRRTVLRLFSPELTHHPKSVTEVVDYYTFHEHVDHWLAGKGILNAATYGETVRFWTEPNIFLPYEARLVRFLKRGGEIRRVFLIGPEIHDPMRAWALYRTLKRHDALSFAPRILSVVDLQKAISDTGIACDMFGVLNGEIGYFFRFPENDAPLMVRTSDSSTAAGADNAFTTLWRSASTFKAWTDRWTRSVPKEIEDLIHRDIECVSILSEETDKQ